MKKKVKKRERTPKKYTHEEWLQSLQYNGWISKHNENMIKDYTNMFFHAMTDVFGFGKPEFEKFIKRLNEIAESVELGDVTWQDLNDTVLDELNVNYIITR